MTIHCFSYVVYGNDPKYFEPLIQNNNILQHSNLDYMLLVFVDSQQYIEKLSKQKNTIVKKIPNEFSNVKRLARFVAAGYVDADYYHYRDSDSVITDLELDIIRMQSIMAIRSTIVRNHKLHFAPILAGLFSLDHKFAVELKELTLRSNCINKPYYDQIFLSKSIYTKIIKFNTVFTSSYFYIGENVCKIKFDYKNFAGKPVDFNIMKEEVTNTAGLKALMFIRNLDRLYQSGKFIRLVNFFCRWV